MTDWVVRMIAVVEVATETVEVTVPEWINDTVSVLVVLVVWCAVTVVLVFVTVAGVTVTVFLVWRKSVQSRLAVYAAATAWLQESMCRTRTMPAAIYVYI